MTLWTRPRSEFPGWRQRDPRPSPTPGPGAFIVAVAAARAMDRVPRISTIPTNGIAQPVTAHDGGQARHHRFSADGRCFAQRNDVRCAESGWHRVTVRDKRIQFRLLDAGRRCGWRALHHHPSRTIRAGEAQPARPRLLGRNTSVADSVLVPAAWNPGNPGNPCRVENQTPPGRGVATYSLTSEALVSVEVVTSRGERKVLTGPPVERAPRPRTGPGSTQVSACRFDRRLGLCVGRSCRLRDRQGNRRSGWLCAEPRRLPSSEFLARLAFRRNHKVERPRRTSN